MDSTHTSFRVTKYVRLTQNGKKRLLIVLQQHMPKPRFSMFWAIQDSLGPETVFVDIGSGNGKLVMEAVLLQNVSHGIGIEISETRHSQACEAIQRWEKTLPSSNMSMESKCGHQCQQRLSAGSGRIEFLLASAVDTAAIQKLRSATHVLLYGLCFPRQTLETLEKILLRELPVAAVVSADVAQYVHRWGQTVVNGRRFKADYGGTRAVYVIEDASQDEEL